MDLADTSERVFMGDSIDKGLPACLIVAVAATSLIQQRQISDHNPAATSSPQHSS